MELCYSKINAYKYRLERAYIEEATPFQPPRMLTVADNWIGLMPSGNLYFRPGYCWDGPSGPTIDTPNWMRGSLVHDGLYQLLREGLLDKLGDHESLRKQADQLMRKILIEDGMSRARAGWSYAGVRVFGKPAARVKSPKRIECVERGKLQG